MFKKGTEYYADWRDALGNRKRKAFATEQTAKAHASDCGMKNPITGHPRAQPISRRKQVARIQ